MCICVSNSSSSYKCFYVSAYKWNEYLHICVVMLQLCIYITQTCYKGRVCGLCTGRGMPLIGKQIGYLMQANPTTSSEGGWLSTVRTIQMAAEIVSNHFCGVRLPPLVYGSQRKKMVRILRKTCGKEWKRLSFHYFYLSITIYIISFVIVFFLIK